MGESLFRYSPIIKKGADYFSFIRFHCIWFKLLLFPQFSYLFLLSFHRLFQFSFRSCMFSLLFASLFLFVFVFFMYCVGNASQPDQIIINNKTYKRVNTSKMSMYHYRSYMNSPRFLSQTISLFSQCLTVD